ncbi:hypothetical protein IAT40_004490 [Kwoniella sp. CBS 6097]
MQSDTSLTLPLGGSSTASSHISNCSTHTLESTSISPQNSSPSDLSAKNPLVWFQTPLLSDTSVPRQPALHSAPESTIEYSYDGNLAYIPDGPDTSTLQLSHEGSALFADPPERHGSNRSSVAIELPSHLVNNSATAISQIFVEVPSSTQTSSPLARGASTTSFGDFTNNDIPPMPTFGSASIASSRACISSQLTHYSAPSETPSLNRVHRYHPVPHAQQAPDRSYSAAMLDTADISWGEDYLRFMTVYSQPDDKWPLTLSKQRESRLGDNTALWPDFDEAYDPPSMADLLARPSLDYPPTTFGEILASINDHNTGTDSNKTRPVSISPEETEATADSTGTQLTRLRETASTAWSKALSGVQSFFSSLASGISNRIPSRMTPSFWNDELHGRLSVREEEAIRSRVRLILGELTQDPSAENGHQAERMTDG